MSKRELPVIQKPKYDCAKCPGWCCTYDWIGVTRRDIARLAKRFGLSVEDATRRFTKLAPDYGRVLPHPKDRIYGTRCMFLDQKTRRCSIYEHRPAVCREFPHKDRCHYFDYLMTERKHQDDPNYVPFGAVR